MLNELIRPLWKRLFGIRYVNTMKYKEYRCCSCGKLFFRAAIYRAAIEIKCKSCKKINFIKEGYPFDRPEPLRRSAKSSPRFKEI